MKGYYSNRILLVPGLPTGGRVLRLRPGLYRMVANRVAIFGLAIAASLGTNLVHAQEKSQDTKASDKANQTLGTTATLESLQGKSKPAIRMIGDPSAIALPIHAVTPVIAEKSFLKHSLKTGFDHLQPGSAQRHFFRALNLYERTSSDQKRAWDDFMIEDEANQASPESIKKVLEPFEPVLEELNQFSRCEDLSFDLRLRELSFAKRFYALLSEVQEARNLARILQYRGIQQIRQKEFAAAMETTRVGIRLAQFVRQGETLVEQLVSIAIMGMMQDCLKEAIQTEGCPNLYYHLAMVEWDIEPLARAINFEGDWIRSFSVLQAAENQNWSEEVWNEKWSELFESLAGLGQSSGVDNPAAMKAIGMAFVVGQAKRSKQNLIDSGFPPEKLEAMVAQQIVAIDTARELESVSNFMEAAIYLPYQEASQAFIEIEAIIKGTGRPQNAFEVIAGLTFPAVVQVLQAHHRTITKQHLLMTVESIREFATKHNRLPSDLMELKRPMAIIDSLNDQPLTYLVERIDGAEVVTLSFESKTLPVEYRTIRFKIGER